MNPYLVSGITGAAPIFNDIMTYVLKDKEAVWPEKPSDVFSAKVCVHGMPPRQGESCQTSMSELYWRESQPSKSSIVKKQTWIRPETGLPPNPGESTDGLVLQEKMIVQDPLTNEYCSDCARQTSEDGKVIYEQRNVSNDVISGEEAGLSNDNTPSPAP
jgi:hypothetical protein